VEQEGRFQRYRANMPLMQDLIGYLTAECCAGHPEQCMEVVKTSPRPKSAAAPGKAKPRKVKKP
jgi:hypothetical protein